MMQGWSAILLCVATALTASSANAETYSWRGMSETLVGVADALEGEPGSVSLGADSDYGLDLRRICSDDLAMFSARLIAADCPDGACSRRRVALAREAKALALELQDRVDRRDALAGSTAAPFVPPGLTLTSVPQSAGDELRLRAAHDLWLRGWMDPLQVAPDRIDRDRWLLLSRVWCDLTRANAVAAKVYVEQFGFSPDDPAIAPTIVNIAIHAAWDPMLTRPLHETAEAALSRNEIAGYYAAQLADIDAMASTQTQVIGTLFSCADGVAYPDPPMANSANVDGERRRYGFGSLAASIENRSRACAAPPPPGR